MANSGGIRVVIASDGKRGHENQSRVVARMLTDVDPLVMLLRPAIRDGGLQENILRLRFRMASPQSFSQATCASLVKKCLQPEDNTVFREFAQEATCLCREGKLFTISTGTPPATFNLVLARLLGARPLVNMTPSLLPRSLFELNIVPDHDTPDKVNLPENVVISPLALSYHDEVKAKFLASELCRENNLIADEKHWGVAVGGPSKACPWQGDRVLDELAELFGLAKGEGSKLLVTTSRRTPEYITGWIKQHYLGTPIVPYLLDANVNPINPLPAFYELCQRMFITGDSFSMVSEAIQAGHHPVILKTSPLPPPGKLTRALTSLAQTGQVILVTDDEESLATRISRLPAERDSANSEYERLRREVLCKLGLEA